MVLVGAADPLNLTGVVTPGDRVPSISTNRVLYRDGVPVAALEGGRRRLLGEAGNPDQNAALLDALRPMRGSPSRRHRRAFPEARP